ncbi:MAG: hypothetical protein DMG48_02425 [Acidobacteria bacterium]|nr:MAG: hypothetical protein DMG48_02425 [Acidobacteriota bacterium]
MKRGHVGDPQLDFGFFCHGNTLRYDNAGRRNSAGGSFARTGLPNAMTQTAYNANNQLTTWGTASLFYDLNGNMTSDGTHSYSWDARNRLQRIDLGNTASFTYDPFGRRATKSNVGTSTTFLYDGANPVQEVIGGTNTANSLSGGVDEVFQRTDSAGARSFLTDALGSTLALTDSSGTTQTSYTFEPFGNTSASGSAATNSFAYTGRELDAGNLYFYRARYYNPQLQRFISEDPIRLRSNSINFYQYAYNSPADFRDPFGLYTFQLGLTLNGVLPVGPVGITYSASFGFAIDTDGHIAWYDAYTPAYLPGLGEGLSGSGGVSFGFSNARSVCGLGGPFLNVSGTGGYTGVAGTVDYFTGAGDGPNGVVDGGGFTLGVGGGGSASVMVTTTDVHAFGRYSSGSDGKIHAQ